MRACSCWLFCERYDKNKRWGIRGLLGPLEWSSWLEQRARRGGDRLRLLGAGRGRARGANAVLGDSRAGATHGLAGGKRLARNALGHRAPQEQAKWGRLRGWSPGDPARPASTHACACCTASGPLQAATCSPLRTCLPCVCKGSVSRSTSLCHRYAHARRGGNTRGAAAANQRRVCKAEQRAPPGRAPRASSGYACSSSCWCLRALALQRRGCSRAAGSDWC